MFYYAKNTYIFGWRHSFDDHLKELTYLHILRRVVYNKMFYICQKKKMKYAHLHIMANNIQ